MKTISGHEKPFNYNALSAPIALTARRAAERIKVRMKRTAEDVILIGVDLKLIKDSLEHGQFLPWIESEFEMSDQTARRFMQVADLYAGKTNKMLNLDPSALYILAAPNTPVDVREEVERLIDAGEIVRRSDIEEMKNRRLISVTATRVPAEAAPPKLKEYEDRIAQLTHKLEEFRHPIPVDEGKLKASLVFIAALQTIAISEEQPFSIFAELKKGGPAEYQKNMAMLETAYAKVRAVKGLHSA